MGLTRTTDPAAVVVTTADLIDHLELLSGDSTHTSKLTTMELAAVRWIERWTRRALITQTWTMTLDDWPEDCIELPRPPLQSVTSVKYYDTDDVQQTWDSSNYVVHTNREPGIIRPATSVTWPDVHEHPECIEIIYVAGYGNAASDVPSDFVMAVKELVAHMFAHRGDAMVSNQYNGALPVSVRMLLDSLRAGTVAGYFSSEF